MQDLQDKFPNAELIGGDAQYEALMAQVVGLIEAPENGLALPLDIRGTAFQQRVWQALRAIPVGETVSYADIARRIGAPKAVRAVAGACAANVLAVAIPVTGWCATTAPCPAIAGASSASKPCWKKRRSDERPAGGAAGRMDWAVIERELDAQGCARLPGVLSQDLCRELAALYPHDAHFRSRVVMARHGFGRGEYRYFAYPLPLPVAEVRSLMYARLAPVANRWNTLLGLTVRYPAEHEAYLAECHRAGQRRPTPLLLRYEAGITTACIRICTASGCFRCRWRFTFRP